MKKQYEFLISVICVTLIGLGIVGFINYRVDPFYYYRGMNEGEKMVVYSEMSSNFGMAKHFDYDSLITGTSMTESFTASQFSENFDCNAIKLPFAGGHMRDFTMLFHNAFSTHELKNVFYGLDIYSLISEPGTTRFTFDKYQISDNPLYDVQYLFNNDILVNYSLNKLTARKAPWNQTNLDNIYIWDDPNPLVGKENLIAQGTLKYFAQDKGVVPTQMEYCHENLEELMPYITEHPDTQFYIFYPPYSILYWQQRMEEGEVSSQLAVLRTATEELLKHENVHLFGFLMDEELITDLDLYKDYSHYVADVNVWMCDQMKENQYRITTENMDNLFTKFEDFVRSYDYKALYE